ncbi:hypothetical protein SAMN02982929_00639 [Saccharopolyspora kobensis]|uniref:Uncharacterized protein n=1 Tax=Saccharopolyspora kobensis TaxID=146035 RepID=A0A1H5USL3_9PSEU|nr:hypothetical protein [Saccharopolyspora kobensis]SEF78112.1 hypothetical protein SAMN02982929_00639 [Saccharopolyspora kobensis]SFC69722.1 hypothetical protein SAMN05216506_1011431 [Saccharopolyspora kobensis]
MTAQHSTTEAALRDAVDTALIDLLTAQHNPADRAQHELSRAVDMLDQHPQIEVSADAAAAVRTAAEHLAHGSPEDARTALVTARGRLSQPGSRLASRNAR